MYFCQLVLCTLYFRRKPGVKSMPTMSSKFILVCVDAHTQLLSQAIAEKFRLWHVFDDVTVMHLPSCKRKRYARLWYTNERVHFG